MTSLNCTRISDREQNTQVVRTGSLRNLLQPEWGYTRQRMQFIEYRVDHPCWEVAPGVRRFWN